MDLDNLAKIQRVEVPPYLFTKIQQKIEQSKKESMPKGMVMAVSLSFALLFILNAIVLMNYTTKANITQSLAYSMHLTSNNSLYE